MATQAIKKQFIEINGIRTAYVVSGTGDPPIVFVHGWSLDLSYWRPQIEHFSKDQRVIAYDWRGMGDTDGGDLPFKFTQLIDDLRSLLTELRIEKPILCGHSEGGDIVLQYAATYPKDVSALILADTPPPESVMVNPFTAMGSDMSLTTVPLAPLAPMYEMSFYSAQFRESNPKAMDAWRKQFLQNKVPPLVNSLNATAARELVKLGSMTTKTLILRGSLDVLVWPTGAEFMRKNIPGAKLYTIEGSGHMTLQEKPDVFNDAVATFLKTGDVVAGAGAAVQPTIGSGLAPGPSIPVSGQLMPVSGQRIPVLGKKKKKKKKKGSYGLRDAQDIQRAVSKASRRIARGVADGFAVYDKRTRKSSRKKRDGAIRDAVENVARGLGKAGRVASWAPVDLIKGSNTKMVRRAVRNVVRFWALPFAAWR